MTKILNEKPPFVLNFYTSLGCHLCEQAKDLLSQCLNPQEFALHSIEIADSDELVERYGVRIPVLEVCEGESTAELSWPFDERAVQKFLRDNCSLA